MYMRTILIDDPEHWRKRAKDTRELADQVDDPTARQTLLEIAQSYDELAELAERRKATEGS
jgi:hypothetical protein